MLCKAKVSFTGLVSMTMGEVKEIKSPLIVQDLLKAGYIEVVKQPKKEAKK